MRGLAELCYRRRWFVVGGWVLLLVGLWMLSSAFGGKFRTEFELPDSESARALELAAPTAAPASAARLSSRRTRA
jgi:RND superfamily putative drug exporter